jgi:hypothetical protein
VTSAATGIISTIVDNRGTHHYDARAATTLVQNFGYGGEEKIVTVPAGLATDLAAISGVQNVIVLRIAPESLTPFGTPNSLISCAGLARVPAAGSCAPGATVARVWSADLDGVGDSPGRSPVWPAAPVSLAQLERLPIGEITVSTNGDPTTIERARTRLEAAYPESRVPPHLGSDGIGDLTKALNGWRRLADVVILVSLPIAGCGLAVSIAGGLSERRRPFSLLRLTGAPLQMLRRVVTLESAVPLLTVAVVAIGAGLLAAHLFLRAQLQYNLHAPGTEYYVIVVVGIAASLGIIASTLPFLGRITGPEMARND